MAGIVNYTEKGFGLHQAIRNAGYRLWHQDGVTYASDPVEVQAIIDAYEDTPSAPPVPPEITKLQLLRALEAGQWITKEEALASAFDRALPGPLLDLVSAAPEELAFEIKMKWAAMTTAYRSDSIWAALVAAGKATSEDVDNLFRLGSTF